jgi:site-specific DNA recombinase
MEAGTMNNRTKVRTAAIYARFSNDELQRQRSIGDQIALCSDLAKRQPIEIVATFCDRGKSSATLFDRDGLFEMMAAAKARSFDVLIVESLDRLSRDPEDLSGLFKRLTFFEVEILTANEGVATPIHVGLRGMVGAMFLKDLGDKVRRGHSGRVREGKFPGATPYGYRRVLGKPGEREIDSEQAAVVRRIFLEYIDGRSPRTIAAGLTADGIPSPKGGRWNFEGLISGNARGSGKGGLIGNPIYRGELVWNTTRRVLNPETGRKVKRAVPPEDFIRAPVPHLAIVDLKLWEAAQAVRDARSTAVNRERGIVRVLPRKEHLLAGLLRCDVCGGHMRLSTGKNRRITRQRPAAQWAPRVACASARAYGTCSHSKSYDLQKLEAGVLKGIRERLADPERIKAAARDFHAEWAEQERKSRSKGATVRKRLNRVQAQIDRLVVAIRDGDAPVTELTAQIKPLAAERTGLQEQLRLIEAESNVVTLHPNVIDAYCVNVDCLHQVLTSGKITPENRAAFRNLIDSIVVHPTGFGKPYEFTPYGRLDALMGGDLFPSRSRCNTVKPDKTADSPPPGS